MKTTFILLFALCFGVQNPQKQTIKMDDVNKIQETITKLFVNTDTRNWSKVESQFSPKVLLDYSSMSGNPATEVTPNEITTAWKGVLPGFTYTHHQIGNFITEINEDKAHSFCYGTATHYLEDENGNVWTVIGSYDFDLERNKDTWKITKMKFNYKYQDGNSKLIEKAINSSKTN